MFNAVKKFKFIKEVYVMSEYLWEDNLLERKVESDLKDVLKTLVAFANTVKPNHIAVLLIGEKDDGTVVGVSNPDNVQKKIREEADKIYPPINWRSKVYAINSKNCIKVEIEYSGDTPHFGGPAWIRKGSETIKATDEVFQRLIDVRLDIVRELNKWMNSIVSVVGNSSSVPPDRKPEVIPKRIEIFMHRWSSTPTDAKIIHVNNFWVTFEVIGSSKQMSEPLKKLTLNFDDNKNRMMVIVDY